MGMYPFFEDTDNEFEMSTLNPTYLFFKKMND